MTDLQHKLDAQLLEKFKYVVDLMHQIQKEANGKEVTVDHVSRVLDKKPSISDTIGLKNTLAQDDKVLEAKERKTAEQLLEVRNTLGPFLSMLAPLNRKNFKLAAGSPDIGQTAGSQFKPQNKISRLADAAPASSLFQLIQDIQNEFENGLQQNNAENKNELQNKLLNTFKMTMDNSPKLREALRKKYDLDMAPRPKAPRPNPFS